MVSRLETYLRNGGHVRQPKTMTACLPSRRVISNGLPSASKPVTSGSGSPTFGLSGDMIWADAAAALTVPIFLAQAANDFDAAATLDLAEELARLDKPHECRIYPPWGVGPREGHLFEVHGSSVWGADVRSFLDRYMA